jgi:2-oxoglutarate ferredoxin oxidoreductase subunit alpha
VAELNLGQLVSHLRSKHSEFNYAQINKVQGMPFTIKEIKDKCIKILEGN